jgi:hypothetical protein
MTVVKIALGKLASEGIEAHLGAEAEAGVRTAMQRYVDRLDSAETPLPLPPFLGDELRAGVECLLELELDARDRTVLEGEAERQMVPLDRIASHAVLTYLAELDAVGAVCESRPS